MNPDHPVPQQGSPAASGSPAYLALLGLNPGSTDAVFNQYVLMRFPGGVLVFIAAFAIGNGAACWVIISEIFPNRIRGLAAAIATAAIWAGCFTLFQPFPWMLETLGPVTIFTIFAGVSLFGSLFVWLLVPETKGRTLEQIEQSWIKHP